MLGTWYRSFPWVEQVVGRPSAVVQMGKEIVKEWRSQESIEVKQRKLHDVSLAEYLRSVTGASERVGRRFVMAHSSLVSICLSKKLL